MLSIRDLNTFAQAPMVTRFAPSPSGLLHLGHAYSAWYAAEKAKSGGGLFIVRVEDIDQARCRAEFEQAIFDDLEWLGLEWDREVRRQSDHLEDYHDAAAKLRERELIYPCFCTRRDIEQAASAPHGPEGLLYPGTCRDLSSGEVEDRIGSGEEHAWRLNLEKATQEAGRLKWTDVNRGEFAAEPEKLGDAVLVRKDIGTSYHIAVVVDDALQNVTHVTRGEDLLYATHLHRLLQSLLNLPVPMWDHHDLVCDENGKRLAKRNRSASLRSIRESGKAADQIIEGFHEGRLSISL